MTDFKNWLLLEMPMQWGNDLALFVPSDGPSEFALFRPGAEWGRILRDYDYDAAGRHLCGIMDMRDNGLYKCWEVSSVWAQHGYGPFTCLVAMTLAGRRGLMMTRVAGQVSAEIDRVWREFVEGAGKNLVTAVPVEGATHHPQAHLNQKLIIKQPVNLRTMKRRSQMMFRSDPYGEKRTAFHEVIDGYLRARMHDVYGTD